MSLYRYQFASPVRWFVLVFLCLSYLTVIFIMLKNNRIETQDVLLQEDSTSKIVEIGPAPILSGMARRTIALKYAAKDASLLVQREVLSYAKDKSKIYYESDLEKPAPVPETLAEKAPTVEKSPSQPTSTPPLPTAAVEVDTPIETADEPAPNTDIIRAMIAHKLRVKFSEIPLSSSVKDLAKGRFVTNNLVFTC